MKANHLPKRNTGIPDVPENRQKCLLTPLSHRGQDKSEVLRGIFAAGTAMSSVPYIEQEGLEESASCDMQLDGVYGHEVQCSYMSA